MRLDKYIADTGTMSRREAAKAARAGQITVDGEVLRDASAHIDENSALVRVNGVTVRWQKYVYVMLNKPSGYISSTEKSDKTVMRLLPPEYSKIEMFPCGRLDIDTVGLLIITNDGPLAHCLLSPRHHAEKTYYYRCDPPITEDDAARLSAGVDIGECVTKPAKINMEGPSCGTVTLTEGKFHQIKRMFETAGSKITYLRRTVFAGVSLDESLAEGEWRCLTENEIAVLREYGEKGSTALL